MKLENILFLDIETVPLHPNYDDLSEEAQQLFADKTSYQRKEASTADFYERAGICLLYTSPSPRDGLLSRMPSSA